MSATDTALPPPTRAEGLRRLATFVPKAGDYAARRNYDLGAGQHSAVSTLSPYLRHRLITEEEVLQAVLARHSLPRVDKFVAEVFWRAYWKGWLELRPGVWAAYRAGLAQALNRVQTESGLRAGWEAACMGQTGIDAYDAWARELVQTGYLHNHARMWFASIWIFTLRLPWELGADFFLRHLLDGDAGVNTLSWRWVAGLQTPGKHYVARADNIARFTEGRFAPRGLAPNPAPLVGPPHPAPGALPAADTAPDGPCALILQDEDLAPGFLFDAGMAPPVACALVDSSAWRSQLVVSPQVRAFTEGALQDAHSRWAARIGPVTRIDTPRALHAWIAAQKLPVVTAHAPVGPIADALAGQPVLRLRRAYDSAAWPHARAGFFRFRDQIPALLARIKGVAHSA